MIVFDSKAGRFSQISKNSIFVLVSLLLFTFQGTQAMGKTLSVPESSPTIKGALIQAQPGDIILVSCGTYFEHDIMMKPGVALWSGTLQPGCVTIDAQGKGRIFQFADADSNTALVGFTLKGGLAQGQNGDRGGAITFQNSSPRISNCIFKSNKATSGGAIFVDQKSSPVLANCLIENNEAQQKGGGAFCLGTVTFNECAFERNVAMVGGGLNLGQDAVAKLQSCSIKNNTAGNTGAGLHAQQSLCAISNTIFAGNWGGLGGSAISTRNADLTLVSSTLYRNGSDSSGGVLAFEGTPPQFNNSIIAFNETPILKIDTEIPVFQGCNLYGNATGDWVAELRSLGQKDDNLSSDPEFCAPDYGNFNLQSSSACLPSNNPTGNKSIVGAFGPGCVNGNEQSSLAPPTSSGFQAVPAGL